MKHRISPAVVGQFGRLLWRLPGEIQLCRRFFICSSVVMEAVRYSMCAQNAPLRKSRAGAASRARATLASEQHAMQCCLVYPRWWSFRAQHLEVSIVRPQRTVLLASFCFSIHAFDMSVLSGGMSRVAANKITEIINIDIYKIQKLLEGFLFAKRFRHHMPSLIFQRHFWEMAEQMFTKQHALADVLRISTDSQSN